MIMLDVDTMGQNSSSSSLISSLRSIRRAAMMGSAGPLLSLSFSRSLTRCFAVATTDTVRCTYKISWGWNLSFVLGLISAFIWAVVAVKEHNTRPFFVVSTDETGRDRKRQGDRAKGVLGLESKAMMMMMTTGLRLESSFLSFRLRVRPSCAESFLFLYSYSALYHNSSSSRTITCTAAHTHPDSSSSSSSFLSGWSSSVAKQQQLNPPPFLSFSLSSSKIKIK